MSTCLLIITKRNTGRITQKTKSWSPEGPGEMGQKGYRRVLYFSKYDFSISFDFCDHVNVLCIHKIKSISMGRRKKV